MNAAEAESAGVAKNKKKKPEPKVSALAELKKKNKAQMKNFNPKFEVIDISEKEKQYAQKIEVSRQKKEVE